MEFGCGQVDAVSAIYISTMVQSASFVLDVLTVFEGVSLTGPTVLDHEWDAIVELKSDLLGGTSLEAVGAWRRCRR